jgi:hypothetical protein
MMESGPPPSNETRWQRANRLGRLSMSVIGEDRRLLIFPAVSSLVNLLIGGLSFALADNLIGGGTHSRRLILLGGIIASYPATCVSLFSGVALATMLARKLDGETVSPSDGWRTARERTGIILIWTLLTCTIGAVLRVLEEYLPLGGKIAALVLDVSWTLATLFAVPVIAYEGLGPRDTLRRSAALFRDRWGEQTAGVIGVSLLGGFLAVPTIVLLIAGASTSGGSAVVLIALGGALLLATQAFTIALNQVYRVFLYRSTLPDGAAATGPFPRRDLENPFRSEKRRWWN